MMSTMLMSRKSKAIAAWCGVLFLVLCIHFYISYNGIEIFSGARELYGTRYRDPAPYDRDTQIKTIKRPPLPPLNPGHIRKQLYTPPPKEEKKQRFPQTLVIGTGKCGTRALLDYLGMHPYVACATREVHFFDKDENFKRGLNWYKAQMPRSYSNQMTIEKSPSYVEHPRTPLVARKINKDMRILWVVKDPVVRLMSVMALHYSNLGEKYREPFLQRVNGTITIKKDYYPLWRGEYVLHLRRWLKYFPLAQIHVLDGTDLVKDPVTEIQEVESFLELPPLLGPQNFYYNVSKGFYCMVPFSATSPQCLGSSKGRKHPVLNATVKTLLYDFFRPYNEQFFKLLGKRFNWEPKD
ncbi:sulfotransferase [Plakobranchus ocellatus]|uniref:Sulfotransferase n=1 Tax=Plakobranchus ocellatus TaxID=259542 RepID=A0AAV4CGB9_9GAST|nr:sulfotransferase [Plakobranchus ocellatus]